MDYRDRREANEDRRQFVAQMSPSDRRVCRDWPKLWRGILRDIIDERGAPKNETQLRAWIQQAQNRGKAQLGRVGLMSIGQVMSAEQ